MIDRILVGTDGSELADKATQAALRLAQACRARVRFLHAIEELSMLGPAPEMEPRLAQGRADAGGEILEVNHQWAREREVPSDAVLRDGSAGVLLMQEARRWGADLIAAGSRGRSGLERAVLGSVADALVRKSPVPVLTVRENEQEAVGPIDRILVPSDGSEVALAAAPLAVELAQRTGARLDLLHAVEDTLDSADKEAAASEALRPLEERCGISEIECEAHVASGRPNKAIYDHAVEHGIDLIVMATRGRGGIERFLLGSIADKVVRTAPVPLITVRPGGEEEADDGAVE